MKIHAAALLAFFTPCIAADLLISGGPIYTGDPAQPRVEALLIRGDKIVFAGDLEPARRQATDARPIDLAGAAAYPGFVDSHAHLTGIGLRELTLNLEQVGSIESLIATVKAWAVAHPGTDPIRGMGWIETHWPEKRFPTRADIDRAVPDRPVYLERADGHAAVANTRALALGKVDSKTRDPAGGQILRDAAGAPTGMLIDAATELVAAKLPGLTPARHREALQRAVELYAARGWTAVHNMSVTRADVQILRELENARKLPIRVDNYLDVQEADDLLANGEPHDANGLVRIRGIKLYMDGALGSRGAALLANYSDAPGNGLLLTQPDVLARILKRARAANVQVATHAIGDRGNRIVLDAYAAALGADAATDHRWRVEHAQIVDPKDFSLFAESGAFPSVQPTHAVSDQRWAESRLGKDRLAGAYAYKSLLQRCGMVALGTDFPVEQTNPYLTIQAAVNRTNADGEPIGGFLPKEALTIDECMKGMTLWPAYASFEETRLGTLEKGKDATFVILAFPFQAKKQFESNYAFKVFIRGRERYTSE